MAGWSRIGGHGRSAHVVRRTADRRDAWRAYRIEVDGEPAGDLGPGEELVIPASMGSHVVQGRIDWTGSPDLEIDVSVEHTPTLLVHVHGPLVKAVLQMRVIARRRYLALEEI